MIDLSQVTYCGLYCGLCASRNRIPPAALKLKEQMRGAGYEVWAQELPGFKEFWALLDKLTTSGFNCSCRERGCGPGFCGIRKCAMERGVVVCALCDDYPCDRIQTLAKGYVTLIADGQRLREIGLDAWIAEQEARVKTGFSYVDIRCEPYQIPDW